MRPPHTTDDIQPKTQSRTQLPGGFLLVLGSPQRPSIRVAATAASHSLLHAPEGDPGKPGQEPTHLTLGFLAEHQEPLRRLLPG